MIKVDNLSYSIHKKEILKNISFEVAENSLTAIIGPNGCGKSTLLSHLTGRISSKKAVFYKKEPIENIPNKLLAKEIAVLTQKSHITSPYLSAKDIVLMGRYPYKSYFKDYSEYDFTIVDSVMYQTGATGLKNTPFLQLSGGEAQRVLIAKAFAQQPNLLLLDEPTNHLDIEHKVDLMKLIKNFSGTTIIVLHDLNLAYKFCDNVIIMNGGILVEEGIPEKLPNNQNIALLTWFS